MARRLPAQLELLSFGFLATLASGFGQTYFVGLFGGQWRADFALSNAGLGTVYSAATLVSGLTMIEAGRWLDRTPLRSFTAVVVASFAVACGLIAVAPEAWMLFPGLLLLRLCGQGLMGHIAITTVARHATKARGRSLSIAQLGFPVGEAVLPSLVVAALALTSWRGVWWACAVVLVTLVLPALVRLGRGVSSAPDGPDDSEPGASRRDVVRDRRFHRVLPVVLAPPFVVTGLFFHQAAVADGMGWPLSLLATAFLAYAVTQVCGGLLGGWAVDRWSARRIVRLVLVPMAFGLASLAVADARPVAFVYMALVGFSAGMGSTVAGALWVELYGRRHLGAIRAMQHALMVVSTAASPVLFGLAIDAGLDVRHLTLLLAAGAVLAMAGVGRIASTGQEAP
ncbi:MAG TPA: MFS transporter [Candidatus Krumholzibacteria bacterium]|nr:MFS transporter [Candidatus Krumholzibacteria bacterium]